MLTEGELRLMNVLWEHGSATVKDVVEALPKGQTLAYTTVMTTLDRLHRKGLLDRHKEGAAFRYRAALSRDELNARIVEETVGPLLSRSGDPVLAAFVDAAATVDRHNLARLERLIAQRRRRGR